MRALTWLLPAVLLLSCAAQAAPDRRPAPVVPIADPSALCEAAATAAEYTARLPPRLLAAISVTETGRLDPTTGRLRPWPWSVDIDGEGQFFETRDDAIAAVKTAQAQGVKSIDVGCMQVNLMFHPDAFTNLEQAFDPTTNARYAAKFLNVLYAGSHDWSHAIAAYHSETPALGDAYRVLVLTRWQNPDLRALPAAAGPASAYQAFAPRRQVYADFQSPSLVYGAFSRNH